MRPSERDRNHCSSPKSRYGYHNYENEGFTKDVRSYTGGYFVGKCVNCGHKKSRHGAPDEILDFNRKDVGIDSEEFEARLAFFNLPIEEQNKLHKQLQNELYDAAMKFMEEIGDD